MSKPKGLLNHHMVINMFKVCYEGIICNVAGCTTYDKVLKSFNTYAEAEAYAMEQHAKGYEAYIK